MCESTKKKSPLPHSAPRHFAWLTATARAGQGKQPRAGCSAWKSRFLATLPLLVCCRLNDFVGHPLSTVLVHRFQGCVLALSSNKQFQIALQGKAPLGPRLAHILSRSQPTVERFLDTNNGMDAKRQVYCVWVLLYRMIKMQLRRGMKAVHKVIVL